jgi:hypothetical protein
MLQVQSRPFEASAESELASNTAGLLRALPAGFWAIEVIYPPSDWGGAWEEIRAQATQSLRILGHAIRRIAVHRSQSLLPRLLALECPEEPGPS